VIKCWCWRCLPGSRLSKGLRAFVGSTAWLQLLYARPRPKAAVTGSSRSPSVTSAVQRSSQA
jgi:hypothetical protein